MIRMALVTTLSLALGLTAALALVSCGGGSDAELLPGTTAQQINENVALVRDLAEAGECVDAQDAALEVSSEVEALTGIDPELKKALEEGADRLNEVVLTCTEETTEETTEESEPTTTETEPVKPKKEKPGKEKHEEPKPPVEEPETEEPPKSEQEPPKGEAKGHEEEPAPPGPPSGGIGPGGEAEGGD